MADKTGIELAEDIMRQCRKAGTAFFFKQDSARRPGQRGRASAELWACKQMPKVKLRRSNSWRSSDDN